MNDPIVQSSRDLVRNRLIEVAAHLLASEGPDAVTTRSVADAADVQAPTIYRIFGDKSGLLDAVAEHGFVTYMAQKRPVDADDDPIDNLRAGWNLHIGFGLENPALFRLMHTAQQTPEGRSVAESGIHILSERVRRVAQAGRLRVTERRAVELIRAVGTGVVFTLIDQPEDERDESLTDLAWESVCATILVDARAEGPGGLVNAAVTLRAALPDLAGFSPAERALLDDWLDRVSSS
ncbi:TetR/AcrR family transcriptional regulator [Glaciihabitans sp. UYNi722]|uniref:TetR/AcrR family transcriptional regulator n=1 Tax=Glaciihabitans sp. UYNi722 TaxID=3156344 RepID=UPI003393E5A1